MYWTCQNNHVHVCPFRKEGTCTEAFISDDLKICKPIKHMYVRQTVVCLIKHGKCIFVIQVRMNVSELYVSKW